MTESEINIKVQLDAKKVPEQIAWNATANSSPESQKAKAMVIAFWDPAEKTALRIDLWTKDMMIDEMADFYFQIFSTMADTFERATKYAELSDDIKKFAKNFHAKFNELEKEKNK
jgi:gliding motility-associated protein GldC